MRELVVLSMATLLGACVSSQTFSTPTTTSPGVQVAKTASGVPQRDPAATYPSWEYFCKSLGRYDSDAEVNELLQDAGRNGWELVTSPGLEMRFCFKRPAPEPVAPTAANSGGVR